MNVPRIPILSQDELDHYVYNLLSEEIDACAKLAAKTVCDVHLTTGVKIYGGRVAKVLQERKNKLHEIHKMTVYNLSDSGKAVTWKEWKKLKGCGISNNGYKEVAAALGPEGQWGKKGVTMGDIASASKIEERGLARYALDRLARKDWVTVEYA